jgi:hypothetical protein
MWQEKIGGIFGFILIFGGIFFFRGCGEMIQVYDSVTMKRENWSPFRELTADRSQKHQAQAKLIAGFYEAFPQKKRSPQTNQDVLETSDKYCELKAGITQKGQIFASMTGQLQRLLEEPSATSIADELLLNLVTVYALANSYLCPNRGVEVFIRPEAPKSYLSAVKQQGFDTQDVGSEFHQKPDATLLVAGYGSCADIYEMGFKQALENKTASFSNTHNISVIYNAAHEHLCSDAK